MVRNQHIYKPVGEDKHDGVWHSKDKSIDVKVTISHCKYEDNKDITYLYCCSDGLFCKTLDTINLH
jgi:hypothetical protein